ETIAAWLARWQGRDMPKLDRVKVFVFAGNHGVTAQGVSAYPAEVTVQMVANFAGGGAAINQLARMAGAELDVIPLDLDHPTGDFTQGPAMDETAFLAAVSAGYDAVTKDLDLICTGVDDAGLKRKVVAIEAGLQRHVATLADPLGIAAALGGRELAAIFGATLAARHLGIPVLLDGFVCTAAAAPLAKLHPTGLAHTIAAHVSAESGHRGLLEALSLPPLLDLGMRLGEGSGACLAVNIVRSALECHARMASFAEAGVSEK
ncbi:MAG: nicotinate-nucleotide--dimethylbenzimidazole phosphoribosyltransferase, partial [Mesorhizobium sp.]